MAKVYCWFHRNLPIPASSSFGKKLLQKLLLYTYYSCLEFVFYKRLDTCKLQRNSISQFEWILTLKCNIVHLSFIFLSFLQLLHEVTLRFGKNLDSLMKKSLDRLTAPILKKASNKVKGEKKYLHIINDTVDEVEQAG